MYNSESKTKKKRRNYLLYAIILFILIAIGRVGIYLYDERPLSIEEAKHLKYYVTVENVNFDVPVLYTYYNYKTTGRRWIRPTQGEIDGTSRREVDHINVEVLLPNMAPYKESNAAEFDTLGRGNLYFI